MAIGSHVVEGTRPFGAFVYGYDLFDSYGYPGGLALAPVARATSVSLSPASAQSPVGAEACVTATVSDVNGSPLQDVRVDFEVTGANPRSAFATSDAEGAAQLCYRGESAGEDTIRASIGALSDTAMVSWTSEGNRPPRADDLELNTSEDTPKAITLAATDPDGDELTYSVVGGPAHGELGSLSADGTLTYTPDRDFNGSDSFSFRASDGTADSNVATVAITVESVNDAPSVADRSLITDENTAAGIELTGTDPDGDELSYTVVSGPVHGTLSGTAPGLTYTPDRNYAGPDSFTFRTHDGVLDSGAATVSITVRRVKHDTSTSYAGDHTAQYSDPVALSARLLDTTADPASPLAGKPIAFALGTQTAGGTTNSSGSAQAALTVTQRPGSVDAVQAAFAGDDENAGSSEGVAFNIAKEDCTVTYSGSLSTPAGAHTTLAADLGEHDSSLGDRSAKPVTFTVTNSLGAPQTFTASTGASGRAQTTVALSAGAYTVGASFHADDFYSSCATSMDSNVVVEAARTKVTGSGSFWMGKTRTSFCFNLIPHSGGTYKSEFQLVTSRWNRFHASGTASVLASSSNSVTWRGSGWWNHKRGYTYTVTALDRGSSKKHSDEVTVKIVSPAHKIVYDTNGSQRLKDGDIKIHR